MRIEDEEKAVRLRNHLLEAFNNKPEHTNFETTFMALGMLIADVALSQRLDAVVTHQMIDYAHSVTTSAVVSELNEGAEA